MQIAGNDVQQLVAIDDGAGVIDHQNTVTITIKRDTQIGVLGQNGCLQLPHVCRTAIFIDVQTIGLRGQHHDLGA
ncbi:hypothetical protein D3C85_972530 [compost metagenome]